MKTGICFMTLLAGALSALALLLPRPAAAGDAAGGGDAGAPPVLPDFFDASRAPQPVPGQWVEYRLGFPADPLESSLQPDPATMPDAVTPGETVDLGNGQEMRMPSFDPDAAWRVLPLRIEVRRVTPEGCDVFLTFDGAGQQVFLPMGEEGSRETLRYAAPADGDDRTLSVTMGNVAYEVEIVRRTGDGYGFVRYFCPDVPFGVFRFATRDVDLVMVGFGQGRPPDFPLPVAPPIDPPVGQLY